MYGVLLAVILAVTTAFIAASGSPAWYDPPAGMAAASAGESLENAVVTQLTLPRRDRGGEWSVSLSETDANAWLATRLGEWCRHRGVKLPAGVEGVQVRFRDGSCTVGCTVVVGGTRRFVAADVRAEVTNAGALRITTEGGRIGRLPVPIGSVVSALGGGRWTRILSGNTPLVEDARISLEDGRTVRLLGVRFVPGRVEATSLTASGR